MPEICANVQFRLDLSEVQLEGERKTSFPRRIGASIFRVDELMSSLLSERCSPSFNILLLLVPKAVLFPAGHLEPLTLLDRSGIHVSLHFAKDSAALAHPDTAVVVISTVNTSALPVSDYVFQAAVPKVKQPVFLGHFLLHTRGFRCGTCAFVIEPFNHCVQTMSVKVQPASGTHLPAYNPVLPPAAISQVLLLANPHKVNSPSHNANHLVLDTFCLKHTTKVFQRSGNKETLFNQNPMKST